jgi:hypothetical protein
MYVTDVFPFPSFAELSTNIDEQLRLVQDLHGTAHDWRPCQGAEALDGYRQCCDFLPVRPWGFNREPELGEHRATQCLINPVSDYVLLIVEPLATQMHAILLLFHPVQDVFGRVTR